MVKSVFGDDARFSRWVSTCGRPYSSRRWQRSAHFEDCGDAPAYEKQKPILAELTMILDRLSTSMALAFR
jgi:hypothetical protein